MYQRQALFFRGQSRVEVSTWRHRARRRARPLMSFLRRLCDPGILGMIPLSARFRKFVLGWGLPPMVPRFRSRRTAEPVHDNPDVFLDACTKGQANKKLFHPWVTG